MNFDIFRKFPSLETTRLILREINLKDTQKVFEFNSHPEALKYIARDPFTEVEQASKKVEEFIKAYKAKKGSWWAFILKDTNKFAGYSGLFNICAENNQAEIGYGLLQNYWGSGLISEIIAEIVSFGLSKLEAHRLYGIIIPGNTASIRVLEKNNFKKEGHLKHNAYARNRYFDHLIYGLINEENVPDDN